MLLVALFGALGAFSPSLAILTLFYSANRLAGSAGWGAMVKIVPEWFPRPKWPLAIGILSLSFVFGGALAVGFAGLIAKLSDDNWRHDPRTALGGVVRPGHSHLAGVAAVRRHVGRRPRLGQRRRQLSLAADPGPVPLAAAARHLRPEFHPHLSCGRPSIFGRSTI
jgi:MFS family permease